MVVTTRQKLTHHQHPGYAESGAGGNPFKSFSNGYCKVSLSPYSDSDSKLVSTSTSAANRSIGSATGCTITEKALTPRSLNVKLGPRHNYIIRGGRL